MKHHPKKKDGAKKNFPCGICTPELKSTKSSYMTKESTLQEKTQLFLHWSGFCSSLLGLLFILFLELNKVPSFTNLDFEYVIFSRVAVFYMLP
jgi:hypothetical protein